MNDRQPPPPVAPASAALLLDRAAEAIARGDHRQSLADSAQALTALAPEDAPGRAAALRMMALNRTRLGENEPAVSAATQALALYHELEDRAGQSDTLSTLSIAYHQLGLYRDALDAGVQAQAAAREAGDLRLECWALLRIGMAYERLDDPALSAAHLRESLALARVHGGDEEVFAAQVNLSANLLGQADHHRDAGHDAAAAAALDAGREFATQALARARESGNVHRQLVAMLNLVGALRGSRDTAAASALLDDCQRLARQHGFRPIELIAAFELARLAQRRGQHKPALDRLAELQPQVLAAGDAELRREFEYAMYLANKHLRRYHRALLHLERHAKLDREQLVQRAEAQARVLLERIEFEQTKRELDQARTDMQAERARSTELEAAQQRLQAEAEAMARAAGEDALTRLPNRRAVEETLPQLLSASEDAGTPLSLAMLDVDHFKRVNDQHGHGIGDAVLAALGDLLRVQTRASDLVARVGGEEFLFVLPGATLAQAAATCERLRLAVAGYAWPTVAPGLAVTISVGLAIRRPGESAPELMKRADEALYRAKHGGRNRVAVDEVVPAP
ncbi:diguanylate cyclase [Aquincola sp. S2]|uniref:diguanylate cyclase n=1 Tax=Pseudaquabacterium terrae TaxID=2732868 RepID=A0ABX2EIJ7_9BURK|nr:GGDEF domain-containing protein [Aquabacterium terrae]NRF68438.1 diguanylate cyclase [Aquabacterium terrae]